MSESLRGQFLIAGPKLRDGNFFKTVVLILEHGESGAMGVIINRPSTVLVSNALSEHFDLPDSTDLVYVGGPVEGSALFILHDCVELDHQAEPVIPGVLVGTSGDVFRQVVEAGLEDELHGPSFRVYSGCSGWGPGQLEGELNRADWLVYPAEADYVFHDDPYEIWDELLEAAYVEHRILPDLDGPPELN